MYFVNIKLQKYKVSKINLMQIFIALLAFMVIGIAKVTYSKSEMGG